jgi:16S rRNA (adenine1518-N6/adenine1519-N6)-dimethyltransferase
LNSINRHLPRKRFGQHFLTDQRVIRRIVEYAKFDPTDRVLEIGPGRGALTIPLSRHVERILAIEMDQDLIPILNDKLRRLEISNVTLINDDILHFDLKKLTEFAKGKAPAIGNLPFNISSPVLEILINHRNRFQRAVLMFQKEVADRLVALPGSKTFGALSVMAGYYGRVTPLLRIGKKSFRPQPKVDAAVVQIDFEQPFPRRAEDEKWFQRVVKGAFAHRRKTIQNSLTASFPSHTRDSILSALTQCSIESKKRAEALSIEDFIELSEALSPILDNGIYK